MTKFSIRMERETGIEPATNSLEGCDSTTELLPPSRSRASAGAVAHVKVAEVVNIARSLEVLKQAGVWTVGLAGDAAKRYDEIDYKLPTAVVVGGEGTGLRRLVRDRCDWLVSIPMRGHVQSLNVSVATGIVLFEAVRQRQQTAEPDLRPISGRSDQRS